MEGFYLFVSISSITAMLLTFFLARHFRRLSIVKYVPSIIAALAGIGFYIKSAYFSTGFEDLGFIVLALISLIVFFMSFITALIMGILLRNKNSN